MKRFVMLLMVLLFTLPMLAQEATVEPTEVVVGTDQPADQTVVVPVESLALSMGEVLLFVFGIVLSGGATIVSVVYRLSKDPSKLKAIESLGDSVPTELATRLVALLESINAVSGLTIEALDRIPAESKVPGSEGQLRG